MIEPLTLSQRANFFKSLTRLWLMSTYLPEILLRENIWEKRGSMPGVVPATRPMFAFGATAMSVAFLMPFLTFARRRSQLRPLCFDVLSTVSGRPRSASRMDRVSIGTQPCDQREPCLLYTSRAPETGRNLVCRLLL